MSEKIFLAGATGALGRVLAPMLIDAGYTVYGSTRQQERAAALAAIGVLPVVVDVFDAQALTSALVRIAPACVIHQLTDLPRKLDPALMQQAVVRNARIRSEGSRNLVDAARAAGCTRMIAQSIAWAYAPATTPYTEDSPLDAQAEGMRRISMDGVIALESAVLGAASLHPVVLRYGQLYGPGTAHDNATGSSPVHVEAAAWATLLATQKEKTGVFNITDDDTEASNARARRELDWHPAFRLRTEHAH